MFVVLIVIAAVQLRHLIEQKSSTAGSVVNRFGSVPSEFMIQMSLFPERLLIQQICRASLVHAGRPSAAGLFVRLMKFELS